MGILDYFPGNLTPRPEQRDMLLQIEEMWNTFDVLTLCMPTGSGKTEVMLCIAEWVKAEHGKSSNLLVPNNLLVTQIATRYPQLTPLHKLSAYRCADMSMDCAEVKETCGNLCKGCVFMTAKRRTKMSRIRLMNYYVYMTHRMYADVVMFDEGHQILDLLQEAKDIKLWHSQLNFPTSLKLVSDFVEWAQGSLARQPNEKLSEALRQVIRVKHSAALVYRQGRNRGRADICLQVAPTTTREVPPYLWPPHRVKKTIFLSATINRYDIEELGLGSRRLLHLECGSPIPADRRPIVFEPKFNLGLQYVEMALPALVRQVESLLAKHPDKGLIHLPYALAAKLQELVKDPRLIFHTKDTKQWALDEFRKATPESGRVLVASGLYEGIDLPYDAARWQLIGKVPYLSLGDPRISAKSAESPGWYAWEAAKRIIQAAGRIVRAPDDYGISYIFDAPFGRLIDGDVHRESPLFPTFFKAALRDMRKHKQ